MPPHKIPPQYPEPGDEVAIISPSFCIVKMKVADAAVILEKWELRVLVGKNIAH